MNVQEIHPCFAPACNGFARIHLPVAPACNLQCNYCVRKFSCVNESRPGVTAKVMTPQEAAAWYAQVKKTLPDLVVAGVAGPGDALANWQLTAQTLKLVRQIDKNVKFCLSTNGLLLPEYARQIAELGVGYVTVTVNAADAETGARLYAFADYQGKRWRDMDAARLLLENQTQGIKLLKKLNITVKINCVAVAGVNDGAVTAVAKLAAALRCDVMNIIPMLPVAGSKFQNIQELDAASIEALRQKCSGFIRQMRHCNRCRADAAGKLYSK